MALSQWIMLFYVEMFILCAMHWEGCIKCLRTCILIIIVLCTDMCLGVNNCIIQMKVHSGVVSIK